MMKMQNTTYYKKSEYNYSKDFWGKNQSRTYEDLADKNAVKNNLPKKMDWLVDIGGGYGRLVPIYKEYAKNIIIADLSYDLLKEAKRYWGKFKNIYYIRINAYHLPFKNQSIQNGISYRLMHHITDQKKFFLELNRVFSDSYLLEFPNKRHLMQTIKYIFGNRNIHIFNDAPEIRDKMFLNYHPKYIKKLITSNTGFKIKRKIGVSFFRNRLIKKIFPISFLMFFERVLQRIPLKSILAPSNIFILRKNDPAPSIKTDDINDLLVCPKCHKELDWKNKKCSNCNRKFEIKNGIIDFVLDEIE